MNPLLLLASGLQAAGPGWPALVWLSYLLTYFHQATLITSFNLIMIGILKYDMNIISFDIRRANKKLMLSGSVINKARCMATPVACGWTGATFVVSKAFGQEQ